MKHLFVCENCGKIFMASTDGTIRNCCGHDMCSDKCANEFMNEKEANVEMNENYIVINGKKAELTEAQLKALGIETRENPFERVAINDMYYFISHFGDVDGYRQASDSEDDALFNNSNYFNDEQFANQVALHQLLYRKLLKFAYDHECEDTQKWDGSKRHWFIQYDHHDESFGVTWHDTFQHSYVYFSTMNSAECAIKEVIMPFIKEHPEFKW